MKSYSVIVSYMILNIKPFQMYKQAFCNQKNSLIILKWKNFNTINPIFIQITEHAPTIYNTACSGLDQTHTFTPNLICLYTALPLYSNNPDQIYPVGSSK